MNENVLAVAGTPIRVVMSEVFASWVGCENFSIRVGQTDVTNPAPG